MVQVMSLVALFAWLASVAAMTNDQQEASVNLIRTHLNTFYSAAGQGLCFGNTCCNMTSSQPCSIANMAEDQSTLVLPGGQTRCIFSDSTPFAFQVIPGAKDKLLFYLQGGGACWDAASTKAKLCSTDASPQSLVGVFDRSNTANRFHDYTIVHVLYCSGDVHGGDVVRPYTDSLGQPVTQKGLANAQSALDWVQKQVGNGDLSGVFTELVVMGCSAGSLGAQLWANQVLQTLKCSTAAVVPDSYAGVFPPGSAGPLIKGFGFCSSGFLSDSLTSKCNAGELELTDIVLYGMQSIPSVPYVFVQAKTDIVQQTFYVSIAVSVNSTQKTITPSEFYADVNDIFGLYNAQQQNFVTYLINGDHHCYTNQALYFTADTISSTDNGANTNNMKLYEYVNTLPLKDSMQISTTCDGTVKGKAEDTTYCSSKVVPKSFVEKY